MLDVERVDSLISEEVIKTLLVLHYILDAFPGHFLVPTKLTNDLGRGIVHPNNCISIWLELGVSVGTHCPIRECQGEFREVYGLLTVQSVDGESALFLWHVLLGHDLPLLLLLLLLLGPL